MRAVDRGRAKETCAAGERLEDVQPNALPAPTIEAVVDRRIGAVFRGAITPARTRTQHVNDAADHPPVIDPVRTAAATRKQRLDPLPFLVSQPVKLLPHQGPLRFGSLESQFHLR